MKRRVLKSELLSTFRPSLTNYRQYFYIPTLSQREWKLKDKKTCHHAPYILVVSTNKKNQRNKNIHTIYITAISVMVYNGDSCYGDANLSEGVWWAAEGITGHHNKFSWEVENEQTWKKEEALWFSGAREC